METINSRIAEIIKESGMSKTDFAKKVNVSQSHVSRMVSGETGVSDRTISDICRVFRVNEEWLRNGTGEKYRKKARGEELAELFAYLEVDDTVKAKAIRTLAELPEEFFVQALEMGTRFLEQYQQEDSPGTE